MTEKKKDLQQYLDYKPNIDYKKKRNIELEDKEIELDARNPYATQLSPFLNPEDISSYLPSIPIADMLEVKPTDLLSGFHKLSDEIADLSNKIIKDLRDGLAKEPHVDDYIKARRENDTDTQYAFEDFHALNVEGDSSAEALTMLLDLQDEVNALTDFLNTEFFNGEGDINRLEELKAQEEENIRHAIKGDMTGDTDIDSIGEDNHIKDFLNEKLSMLSSGVAMIEDVITDDLNHSYGGQAMEIIDVLTEDASLIDSVREVNELRFQSDAANSEDVRNRMKRLSSAKQKTDLLKELRALQKKKLQNRNMLRWMEGKELKGHEPINMFFLDILKGIQKTNDITDMLSDDIYAVAEMDRTQLEDYIVSLRAKQSARNIDRLSKEIQKQFNFNDKDKRAQVSKFAKHVGLDSYKAKESHENRGHMHGDHY